jgi:hypothetical protein
MLTSRSSNFTAELPALIDEETQISSMNVTPTFYNIKVGYFIFFLHFLIRFFFK